MRIFRACVSIFKIKLASGMQYRIAGFSGALTSTFWGLIMITVYSVFYKYSQNSGAGIAAGMTLAQTASYVWLAQFLFAAQPGNIDPEILDKIQTGDVGIELCRPMNLYFHWYAKNTASRMVPLLWRGLPIYLVSFFMPEGYRMLPPTSVWGFLLFIFAVFNAVLFLAAFATMVCAIRLNVVWGDGPMFLILLIGGIFSGSYLPLKLWPDFMQSFLFLQPFASSLDIPIRLYLGTIDANTSYIAFAVQWLWIIIFVVIGKILITRQLKNIVVQGG